MTRVLQLQPVEITRYVNDQPRSLAKRTHFYLPNASNLSKSLSKEISHEGKTPNW
jgi:hypothetical protein